MTGKQLRNSILQWAIQGKLVPQDPSDEPASVLLEQIRVEKARLVKEKIIKHDKNETIIYRGEDNSYYEKTLATGEVKCIDDEIPFEIPQGWEWCRLESILDISSARRVHEKDWRTSGIPFYRAREIGRLADYGRVTNDLYIDQSLYDKFALSGTPQPGDLMITAVGTLGKVYIVPQNHKFYYKDGSVLCLGNKFGLIPEYLKLYIHSNAFIQQYESDSDGTTVATLTMVRLKKYFVPVPPLKEQKRIVEKVLSVFPNIGEYEVLYNNLTFVNSSIKDRLRTSILQEAIQGRLVPQIESEGTAEELLEEIRAEKKRLVKEGKLKKSAIANESRIFRGDDNKYYENRNGKNVCIDDEVPFIIPNSWAWVRLDDICLYIQRGKSPKYSPIKKVPVIAQKCNQWSGFQIEKAQFIEPSSLSTYGEERLLQDGDLMWNSTGLGTLGRMAIYCEKLNPYGIAVADSHVTVIRPFAGRILSQYLFAYFTSNTVQSVIEDKSDGTTKQKELSTTTVKNYLVPLPPYSEQQRIVSKINEALASIMSR